MWSYLTPRNLISIQREAAIRELDRRIAEEHAAGYGVDVDRLLERRHELRRSIDEARA